MKEETALSPQFSTGDASGCSCNCCHSLALTGAVHLVYRDQIRSVSLLGEKPKSLTEVRVMFVRAFPESFGSPDLSSAAEAKQLFVLDRGRNVYVEFTDLEEIRPNSVLLLQDLRRNSGYYDSYGPEQRQQLTGPCPVLHQQHQHQQRPQLAMSSMRQNTQSRSQQLICTCPHEIKQAMSATEQCWPNGRPQGMAHAFAFQTTATQQGLPSATNRTANLESQMTCLAEWQNMQYQQQMLHQYNMQQQQLMQQAAAAPSLPVRSVHAPSNSSLDSAFSGQSGTSNNSDVSTGSLHVASMSPRVASQQQVRADALFRVRREAAQLKSDFESLRATHRASVRAMNDMFAERMLAFRTFMVNMQARQQLSEERLSIDTTAEAPHASVAHASDNRDRTIRTASIREATPTAEQWSALMRSIEAFVPDREARLRGVRAIDSCVSEHRAHSIGLPPAASTRLQPPAAFFPAAPQIRQRPRTVAFSDTVMVDDGSQIIRLNCSSDASPEGRENWDGRDDEVIWRRQAPVLPLQRSVTTSGISTRPAGNNSAAARGANFRPPGGVQGLLGLNCGRPGGTKP